MRNDFDKYSLAELSVIQALVGRRRKFTELKKDTRFTSRWLDKTLKDLRDKKVVKKSIDEKNDLLGWELEPKWVKENESLVRTLGVLRSHSAYVKAKLDREFDTNQDKEQKLLFTVIGAYLPTFALACAMQLYKEDKLYKIIRDQAIREITHAASEAFDSAKRMTKSQLVASCKGFFDDMDLTAMTFDQFMNKLPTSAEIDQATERQRKLRD